jgi:hypothetical protein
MQFPPTSLNVNVHRHYTGKILGSIENKKVWGRGDRARSVVWIFFCVCEERFIV